MNCNNHESRPGVNTCGKCGSWLCEDCSLDIDGRIICKRCVTELLNSNTAPHGHPKGDGHHRAYRDADPGEERARAYRHADHHHGGYRGGDPRIAHRGHEVSGGSRRHISRFWLFVLSFTIPGVNYMFMGLIKRGIYAMSMFLLAFYCAIDFNIPLLGLLCGVIYTVSIFDGFRVRRMLMDGEYVEDGFSEISNAIYRHKIAIGIVAFLMIGSSVFSSVFHSAYYSFYRYPAMRTFLNNSSAIFVLIVIAAVFYFFIKPTRKGKRGRYSGGYDRTDDRGYDPGDRRGSDMDIDTDIIDKRDQNR